MAKTKKPKPVKKPKSSPLTTTDDGIVGGRPDDRNPAKKP